ncbi:hypothetical protein BD779DRAFT_1667490 [Infundibulicybe gibba]|nr:hypothetical protein BD779DRAFT_1667490 [Infundibulicybe gibba]
MALGIHHSIILFSFLLYTHAQIISTNTPVPPLQWINLTALLQGSSPPPPLKDAAIGYDETSRSVIIFGGESANGLVQSQTYILSLGTLTWSIPSPPASLQRTPPARSAAIAGGDFAASNRHGFVIIGGKGSDGNPLTDEYDFNNQFWAEVGISPGGPSPRWGASGGIDIRVSPISDPVIPGPNNTFYLAGGFDGNHPDPLSDVWRLNVSGTLSSNLPTDAKGTWENLMISDLPARVGQAGTVISHQIAIAGGCSNASASGNACAQQDSFVVDAQRRSSTPLHPCPAPRLSPVLTQNFNPFSSSFSSQAFLLLGTFDKSLWQDDGGLDQGEVAVLDINTGSWSRILPSGDPGTSGSITFPTAREGAAAVSYPQALLGNQPRNSSSDIIVFGGRDSSGKYLSEVWLLRSYAGAITASNPTWSGFGDGKLQSGASANGAGVRPQILNKCVSMVVQPNPTSTIPVPQPSPSHSPAPPQSLNTQKYNTSILHKIFAPVSLALFLPIATFTQRLHYPNAKPSLPFHQAIMGYISIITAIIAYGVGAAGLVIAFTTISSLTLPILTPNRLVEPAPSSLHLRSMHGKGGLALFLCFYVLALGFLFSIMIYSYFRPGSQGRGNHTGLEEKREAGPSPPPGQPESLSQISPPSSPRHRSQSWGPSALWRSHDGGPSSDGESTVSTTPQRGFEVTNRPSRHRRASGSWIPPTGGDPAAFQNPSMNLSDVDWLQRRRSLNAVGELDYVISQTHRSPFLSTPGTADALMDPVSTPGAQNSPAHPTLITIALLGFGHASLLGLVVITLIKLWPESKPGFGVFLGWVVCWYIVPFCAGVMGAPRFYSPLITLANGLLGRHGRPPPSSQPDTRSQRRALTSTISLLITRHPLMNPYHVLHLEV